MNVNPKALIPVFCMILIILIPRTVLAEQAFKFVETTGRAIISDESSIDDARRNSLEDAIFLAAIHGGANINGFSSVDKETNLSEHFTLRPAGELLDYTILDESMDNEHYRTTIRAAVGELKVKECSTRSIATIMKFGGEFNFSAKLPAWLRQNADEIENEISKLLKSNPNINLADVSPTNFATNKLTSINDSFDYTSLTRGKIRVENGDFALVPLIAMKLIKSKKNIENELFLSVSVTSNLYSGETYELIDSVKYEVLIKLRSETPWRTFDILGKKTRDQIKLAVNRGLDQHVLDLVDKIRCVPLTATIKMVNEKLTVNLGHSHGITSNSLAVSSGTNTPYSILYVTEVKAKQSTIEPLNQSLELSSLIGKKINFMESVK